MKKKVKAGSHGAEMAIALVEKPDRILSTTLLMSCLCVIGISALSFLYVENNPKMSHYSGIISILISSPLIIFFGEILPKTLFQKYSNQIAPKISYFIYWTYWILYPLTRALSFYTSRFSRLVSPIFDLFSWKKKTSREEIRSLLNYSRREMSISHEEKKMIKKIFDFKNTEAKHALIPLVKVDAIEENSTVRDSLEKFQQHRHSRMPVYSGRIDNIIGVLHVADLILTADLSVSIKPFVRSIRYIPETQTLEDLLEQMHHEGLEMVTVVDEYGGAIGILTLEDIIEEITGEIQDEYDTARIGFRKIDDSSWWVQAKMEIDSINENIKLELPEGDYETLGGFLLQQFGRIPSQRDELIYDTPAGTFKFTIKTANERFIETVLIEKLPTYPANRQDTDI